MPTPAILNDSVIVRTDPFDGDLYVNESLPLLLGKLDEGIKQLGEHNKTKNIKIKEMKLTLIISYQEQTR